MIDAGFFFAVAWITEFFGFMAVVFALLDIRKELRRKDEK